MNWFEVDKDGLAKLVDKRGKSFVIFELLQNAFDEQGVTNVNVRLGMIPGRPLASLEVIDNSPNHLHHK